MQDSTNLKPACLDGRSISVNQFSLQFWVVVLFACMVGKNKSTSTDELEPTDDQRQRPTRKPRPFTRKGITTFPVVQTDAPSAIDVVWKRGCSHLQTQNISSLSVVGRRWEFVRPSQCPDHACELVLLQFSDRSHNSRDILCILVETMVSHQSGHCSLVASHAR